MWTKKFIKVQLTETKSKVTLIRFCYFRHTCLLFKSWDAPSPSVNVSLCQLYVITPKQQLVPTKVKYSSTDILVSCPTIECFQISASKYYLHSSQMLLKCKMYSGNLFKPTNSLSKSVSFYISGTIKLINYKPNKKL